MGLSGGVSPLLKNTEELTNKLNFLSKINMMFFAMRHQKPSIKSVRMVKI